MSAEDETAHGFGSVVFLPRRGVENAKGAHEPKRRWFVRVRRPQTTCLYHLQPLKRGLFRWRMCMVMRRPSEEIIARLTWDVTVVLCYGQRRIRCRCAFVRTHGTRLLLELVPAGLSAWFDMHDLVRAFLRCDPGDQPEVALTGSDWTLALPWYALR